MQRMVHRGYKNFGGLRYYFLDQYHYKLKALQAAKSRRESGYKVRIVEHPGLDGYFLYERHRTMK